MSHLNIPSIFDILEQKKVQDPVVLTKKTIKKYISIADKMVNQWWDEMNTSEGKKLLKKLKDERRRKKNIEID